MEFPLSEILNPVPHRDNLWTVESLHLRNNECAGQTAQINPFENLANDKSHCKNRNSSIQNKLLQCGSTVGSVKFECEAILKPPPLSPPSSPVCGEETPEHCRLWRDPNVFGAPWTAQSPEQKLLSTLGKLEWLHYLIWLWAQLGWGGTGVTSGHHWNNQQYLNCPRLSFYWGQTRAFLGILKKSGRTRQTGDF